MRETLIIPLTLLIASILLYQAVMLAHRTLRRWRFRRRRRTLHLRYLLNVRSAAIRITFAVRATDDQGVTLRSADYLALVRALSTLVQFERSPLSHKYKKRQRDLETRIPASLSGL